MEVSQHSPHPKIQQRHRQGISYRPMSLLSVIADTGEEPSSYINANTPTPHGYKTQHCTVTALHTLNNSVAKGVNQMAHPVRTITVTINIHTLFRKLLQTKIPCTIIKFIANYIKGCNAYPHPSSQRQNWRFTFTLQTYHHPEHRFRSWSTQMTSPSHLHTSTSAAKKCIQPYLHKVFAWTKQNNLHSVHSRSCRISEQSGPQNKQHCTTHGNAPKGSGPYHRPKTHIQHTHSQHISTRTQATTNDKSTHRNRMG